MNIYGPVPSRRLGYSLGVDLLPYKSCSFDCVYCQLGPTTRKTVRRREFFSPRDVLAQIRRVLASGAKVDCITFSGSGEPTLSAGIGTVIAGIKKMTSTPVVVLTNSSLLSRPAVRKALLRADIVVPTLDAGTQAVFVKVHRPHPSLRLNRIVAGLKRFRQEFRGQVWLEVMLVKGVNDRPSQLRKLRELIALLEPDKVHMNTVVRPPADKQARPLSLPELRRIRDLLGPRAEIIADFGRRVRRPGREEIGRAVVSALRRRPMTRRDLGLALGRTAGAIGRCLTELLKKGEISMRRHKGTVYYASSET